MRLGDQKNLDMADRSLSVAGYVFVLAALVVLTVVTVGVSFVPVAGHWHIAIGLAIALVKASLVALFFMHVTSSHRLNWSVIAVAVFWLIIFVSLTFCDYLTRGLVPFMPGH
jgi:cytochrome c oxidase subunit 4